MVENSKTSKDQGTWFNELGKYRDALLLGLSITYAFGFAVWSVHSFRFQLGLLPIINSQYIAAGLIPVLIIFIGYLLNTHPLYLRFMNFFARWVFDTRSSTLWSIIYIGFFLISTVGLLVLDMTIGIDQAPLVGLTILILVVESFIILSFNEFFKLVSQAANNETLRRLFRRKVFRALFTPSERYFSLTRFTLSIATVIFTLFWYTWLIYPNIPQEFGGARPRCALLDIDRTNVSESILRRLVIDPRINTGESVVRSVRLYVFYSSQDFLLVKPQDSGIPDGFVIEIRDHAINAITWCGY